MNTFRKENEAYKKMLECLYPTETQEDMMTRNKKTVSSRDIKQVIVIRSDATINADKLLELRDKIEDDSSVTGFPNDNCFFLDLAEEVEGDEEPRTCSSCNLENDDDARFCKKCGATVAPASGDNVKIKQLNWCGGDSMESFDDTFVKLIVPHIHGQIEAIAIVQNTQDYEPVGEPELMGILVEDGTCTKCDVKISLAPRRD